jgi:hypothetical protein
VTTWDYVKLLAVAGLLGVGIGVIGRDWLGYSAWYIVVVQIGVGLALGHYGGRWFIRRAAARAIPPSNVRLVLEDGTELPVECRFSGYWRGRYNWMAVVPWDQLGQMPIGLRCDTLPGRTRVEVRSSRQRRGDAPDRDRGLGVVMARRGANAMAGSHRPADCPACAARPHPEQWDAYRPYALISNALAAAFDAGDIFVPLSRREHMAALVWGELTSHELKVPDGTPRAREHGA